MKTHARRKLSDPVEKTGDGARTAWLLEKLLQRRGLPLSRSYLRLSISSLLSFGGFGDFIEETDLRASPKKYTWYGKGKLQPMRQNDAAKERLGPTLGEVALVPGSG